MQSAAKQSEQGLDGMAREAGEGTEPFGAVPNRQTRARSQTKTWQRQTMTQAEPSRRLGRTAHRRSLLSDVPAGIQIASIAFDTEATAEPAMWYLVDQRKTESPQ